MQGADGAAVRQTNCRAADHPAVPGRRPGTGHGPGGCESAPCSTQRMPAMPAFRPSSAACLHRPSLWVRERQRNHNLAESARIGAGSTRSDFYNVSIQNDFQPDRGQPERAPGGAAQARAGRGGGGGPPPRGGGAGPFAPFPRDRLQIIKVPIQRVDCFSEPEWNRRKGPGRVQGRRGSACIFHRLPGSRTRIRPR